MKITVIVMSTVKVYSEFNQNGFFIGTRDNLGGFLLAGNEDGCIGSEYDDLEIEAFASRMDLHIKYYEVEDADLISFCQNYGNAPEPIESETNLRQTIFEIGGNNYLSQFCILNKNFCFA
jgi:hypothetical protein